MTPRAKNYLIALLSCATLAAGWIAWDQHQSLISLQAELLKSAAEAPPKVAKRKEETTTANAPKVITESDTDDFITVTSDSGPVNVQVKKPNKSKTDQPATPPPIPSGLITDALRAKARQGLDRDYADLFKKLRLPPDQLDKLKNLLIDRSTINVETMLTAKEQGLDVKKNREQINQLVDQTKAEVDASIKATLGETAYKEYQTYVATAPQRSLVKQIDQRLSYSATSLSDAQNSALVNILYANKPQDEQGGYQHPPVITDEVIQQAQATLSPDQVAVLKQIQAEQAARAQAANVIIKTSTTNKKSPTSGSTTSTQK